MGCVWWSRKSKKERREGEESAAMGLPADGLYFSERDMKKIKLDYHCFVLEASIHRSRLETFMRIQLKLYKLLRAMLCL